MDTGDFHRWDFGDGGLINAEFPKAGRALQNCEPQITDARGFCVGVWRLENDIFVSAVDLPSFSVERPLDLVGMTGGGFHEIGFRAGDVSRGTEVDLPPRGGVAV